MWDCPNEVTIEDAYQALKYMEQTHNKNRPKAICHLCLAVFHKENPKKIIGWCGLDGEAELGWHKQAELLRIRESVMQSMG